MSFIHLAAIVYCTVVTIAIDVL